MQSRACDTCVTECDGFVTVCVIVSQRKQNLSQGGNAYTGIYDMDISLRQVKNLLLFAYKQRIIT